MDLLEEHYDDYLAWLYRQSDTIVKREPTILYYDARISTLNASRPMTRSWTRSRVKQ